jgi:nitrogen fixation/metabolism regulation signal transduction histidine kinase
MGQVNCRKHYLSLRKSLVLYVIAFVVLAVFLSDDGKGFDKSSLQKATSPYYTEENNHSEHFGLGLYICKLLCEHHNGYLKIENTATGANVSAYFKSPAL